jgi:hypothetical protein
MFTYRHKLISLIVLVALASLLSLADKVIRGLEYDYTAGRILLSTLTTLYIGGSALYYLFKERRKYAYAFISVYYLGLIVATFAALYSVAQRDGVNQFVISTSFYLNHISKTYLFAYWFLVFTPFFTICSIVIVILSSNLLLDQWNRERAFSSMRNSDLVKEFWGCIASNFAGRVRMARVCGMLSSHTADRRSKAASSSLQTLMLRRGGAAP